MANRETSIAYENLNRRIFSGVGEYGIPQIKPETFEGNCEKAYKDEPDLFSRN